MVLNHINLMGIAKVAGKQLVLMVSMAIQEVIGYGLAKTNMGINMELAILIIITIITIQLACIGVQLGIIARILCRK